MKHLPILLLLFGLALEAEARPNTYEAATSVLGQKNLNAEVSSPTPTARSLSDVDGVAIDPTSGKLFVADQGNHRILRFSSVNAYVMNGAAEAVFGQPNFTSNAPNGPSGNPSAKTLDTPAGLCVDRLGTLWVADYGNARVLRFDKASTKASQNASADGVIGQNSFSENTPAANSLTLVGFDSPMGVAVDAQGRLWVSDEAIPRVLRFDNASLLGPSYAGAASGYLGKEDGTSFVYTSSSEGFGSGAAGLSIDSAGRLWVTDPTNNRVLRFDAAGSKANGTPAEGVLGQATLNSAEYIFPPTAASMANPYHVTAAPDGTVWVSDFSNNRVLGFLNGASKANGANANIVLGQPNFTSTVARPNSANTIKSPSQIAIGQNDSLFIGQTTMEGLVKRWSDPITLKAPKAKRASRAGKATLRGKSSGAKEVRYRVPGQGGFKKAKGTVTKWTVNVKKLKRPKTNVKVRAIAFDKRMVQSVVKVSMPRLKAVPQSKR